MAQLEYTGKAVSANNDLGYQGYIDSLLASNLSTGAIDAAINAVYANFATVSYVDAQDALNATQAYVDTGDATRLKLSQKNIVNGIAALDNTGKIGVPYINVASTQRYPRAFWSPAAYNSGTVTCSSGTETQIYTCGVTDPGFTYKLCIFGTLDGLTSADNVVYPLVNVRVGTSSGAIVAEGRGLIDLYTNSSGPFASVAGTTTYTIPGFATSLDVVALGAGRGGQSGGGFAPTGKGGTAGGFSSSTIVMSAHPGVTSLSVTVGAGGAGGTGDNGSGGNGGASTVTASGISVSGAGGSGNAGNQTGASPGSTTFDGNTFTGGAAQPTHAQPGNGPGGGGAGGNTGLEVGGKGADGAVWIIPVTAGAPTTPNGVVNIMPVGMGAQSPLTGATTIYVMLSRSTASGTTTVTNFRPNLWVQAVPA